MCRHVRQGLAMLYALPDYQREMLKTAARLVPDILDRVSHPLNLLFAQIVLRSGLMTFIHHGH